TPPCSTQLGLFLAKLVQLNIPSQSIFHLSINLWLWSNSFWLEKMNILFIGFWQFEPSTQQFFPSQDDLVKNWQSAESVVQGLLTLKHPSLSNFHSRVVHLIRSETFGLTHFPSSTGLHL